MPPPIWAKVTIPEHTVLELIIWFLFELTRGKTFAWSLLLILLPLFLFSLMHKLRYFWLVEAFFNWILSSFNKFHSNNTNTSSTNRITGNNYFFVCVFFLQIIIFPFLFIYLSYNFVLVLGIQYNVHFFLSLIYPTVSVKNSVSWSTQIFLCAVLSSTKFGSWLKVDVIVLLCFQF